MPNQRHTPCPICRLEEQDVLIWDYGERLSLKCARCGDFTITRTAAVVAQTRDFGPKLCAWIREQSDAGGPVPEINSRLLKELAGTLPAYTVSQKQVLLLKALERRTSFPGQAVDVIPRFDYPLAWAAGEEELTYLLRSLSELNLTRRTDGPADLNDSFAFRLEITANGWRVLQDPVASFGPNKSNTSRVFVSHSWADNDVSRKLAEYLKRDGAEIWIDYARISGGDSLPEIISKAIDWCDTMILIWSKEASESYFVKLEWTSALTVGKQIIPCVLDGSRLPTILSGHLYRSFRNFEAGYGELIRDLKLHCFLNEKRMPAGSLDKPSIPMVVFRNQRANLSIGEIAQIIKKYDFFDHHLNKEGKGFTNTLEVQNMDSVPVVVDHASGLIWQQSGSSNVMKFEDAEQWLRGLNGVNYGGYHSWRLPTLEEAMSLVKPFKNSNDLYIEQVFDKEQRWIWTCDILLQESRPCAVDFGLGRCLYGVIYIKTGSVRVVCSEPPSVAAHSERQED